KKLLDGSMGNTSFQIGSNANETVSFGLSNVSASALRGSHSSATVAGAEPAGMKAEVVGNVVRFGETTGDIATTYDATSLSVNGTQVAIEETAAIADVAAAINADTATQGVTAVVEGDNLTFSSAKCASVSGLGGLGFANDTVTLAAAEGTDILGLADDITVNGTAVTVAATDNFDAIATKITAALGGAGEAKVENGRLTLTSADGEAISLANADGNDGLLGKLGLTAGTTQAKLEADTSITLNGTEVKLAKGSDMEAVVTAINTASTGVTATNNGGQLGLFSQNDFTIADGAAGTGLAALGLTASEHKAVNQEMSVSNLDISSADGAQQAIQVLDG